MKKLLLLIFTFCLVAAGASAQGKKTWDFEGVGLSDETRANLDADEANWTKEGTNADGLTTGWKEAKKHTGELQANGKIIPELVGIGIQNSGLSSSNNVIVRPKQMRINRNNMKFTLPKLANGQTITIDCQSANGTATNRGVKASYDYMKRIEGPEDNLILGSAGKVRNVWRVETDETDSVDIEFTLIQGGIDFKFIQIDEGDELKTAKVAYLNVGNTTETVYNYLNAREATELTTINVITQNVTAEELQQYDVTIVGAGIPADNAVWDVILEAMPWTPVLNLNANLYTKTGYGTLVETGGFIKIADAKNTLFKDVDYEESDEGNVIVYSSKGFDAKMQAIEKITGYFNNDPVIGKTVGDGDYTAIHTHNIYHNGYIYLPYVDDLSDAGIKLLDNAIITLQNSKAEITSAPSPVIKREYKNMETIVTITAPALPNARVFYTTDGSDPTVESQEYTDPFSVTSQCTVRAAAIAEGYTLSKASQMEILVKEQPAMPRISVQEKRGETKITFRCATAEARIWYNFKNSTDTINSSIYNPDSVDVVIKMPQDVTAFATVGEPGEAVFSEITQQRVLVRKPRVVIDVAGHFRAAKWDDVANGGGVFSNGKTATSMYDTSAEGTTVTDPETGDEITVYPEVEWMTRDEAGDDPQWQIMSKGQSVLWQNLTAQTGQIGTNEGGYFPSVAEDIDPLFPITSYDIQFYSTFAGEPANAAIMSKGKYQGPLDIVTIANMQGGPILTQVSTDGEKWITVGDEIAKTGYTRMWKKYTNSYYGEDEVYVRIAQTSGGAGAKIFDIYVANEGENSKALLDQLHAEYGNWDDNPGDTNGDGSVDVADISFIITVMAGSDFDESADVNGDGTVDVADISNVITIMAGN